MAKMEELAKKMDIHGMITVSMTTAFAFVAGLFWRDAIQQFISEVIPEGEGLLYSFGVAIMVTVIAAIVIIILVKSQELKKSVVSKKLVRKQKKK